MSKKILIVEDEAIIALTLAESLVGLGYEVCGRVSRGEDVLQEVKKCNPDLILMDIMLKGKMTGVDAAEVVHSFFDTPIVFLTAYSNDEIFKKAKITNPYGYIIKPFQERELEINIEIALYKHETQKKIIESEKKYRDLAESIPQIVFDCDSNGQINFLNESGLEMLDYYGDSVQKGINICDWFVDLEEMDDEQRAEFIQNRISGKLNTPFKLKTSRGRVLFFTIHMSSVFKNDELVGYRGIMVDVTTNRKNELVLELTNNVSKLALSENVEKKEIMEYVFDKLGYIFEFDELYVGDYYPKTSEIHFIYNNKIGFLKKPVIRAGGNGLSEYMIRTNKGFCLNYAQNKVIHEKEGLQYYGEEAKSWMGVPIHDSNKVCGIVAMQCFVKEFAYNLSDLEGLQTIANHVGLITEKIRTKTELEKSEKKYKGLFESIIDVYFVVTIEGKILEISPSIFEMTGYTPQEYANGNLKKYFKDFDHRKNLVEALKTQDKVFDFQITLIHKNGKEIIVSVNAKAIRDAQGNLVAYEAVSRDITTLKEQENLLRDSLHNYETLFNASPEENYIIDFKTLKIEEVNDSACVSLGYKREELLNLKLYDIASSRKYLMENIFKIKDLLMGQKTIIYGKHKRKNGELYDVEILSQKIKYKGKSVIQAFARELTSERKLQLELNQSEHKYKSLIDTMSEGLTFVNKNGSIEFVNKSFLKLVGYEIEDVLEDDFIKNLLDEEGLNFFEEVVNTEEEYTYQFKFKCKSGEIKHVQVNSRPIIENNELKGRIAVHTDITQYVNSTNEKLKLQKTIKTLSSAVENTNDLVCVANLDGEIIYSNEAYQDVTGFSEEELIGRNCNMLKSGFHDKSFYDDMWRILKEDKKSFKAEFINKKRNGDFYFEDKTISPILNENGEIDSFVSIGRDITEKKNIVRKLEESERRYRSILENVSFIAIQLNPKGEITYANQKTCDVLGCESISELIGKNWFENFIPKDEQDIINNRFKENLKKESITSSFTNNILTKTKKHRIISWTNTMLFNEKGEVVGVASLGDDVTEVRRVERRLQSRTKLDYFLEKRNRKKALKQLLKGQEQERKRISRELHDGLGQQLAGLKFLANSLKRKQPEIINEVDMLTSNINETINEVRRISYDLMPSALSDFGLLAGIEKVLYTYKDAQDVIDLRLSVTGQERRFDEQKEVSAFRIFQEALNNAIKHSGSDVVEVDVRFDEAIEIVIKDFGVWEGYSTQNLREKGGNGISNMLDRAESSNITLNIENGEAGTKVNLKIEGE